jgi:hypothetical protein
MTSEWRQSEVDRVAHVYIGALDEPGFRLRACDSNLVVPGRLTKPRSRRCCKRCKSLCAQANSCHEHELPCDENGDCVQCRIGAQFSGDSNA